MTIQILKQTEIDTITGLQPPGWNDIRGVFNQFIQLPFFHPVKIKSKNEILAIGEAISNKHTAWIGNVIVHPNHRGNGLGAKVTQHLMDYLKTNGKQSQFLLATEIGRPLYEKLGFKHISQYIFFKKEAFSLINKSPVDQTFIRSFHPKFANQIYALDMHATGEDRSEVLQHFLKDAKLYVKENIVEAFYLPQLGDGLIIAKNATAGIVLSKLRMLEGQNIFTVPEQNKELITWVESNGFNPYRRAYKMYIGAQANWQPEMIFSRIGGYLG